MNTNKLSKNVTYKPKDALRAIGEDIPENQRGRMSSARVAMIKELVSQGYSIVGYSTVVSTDTAVPDKVEKVATTGDVIAELYYRYDEHTYKAVAADGTVYGMREACNNCGYSLMGHLCDSPSVLSKPVEVMRR